MSIVIENTYCSPKFINLKRSLFWQTYVYHKGAISLSVCLFLSLFSSVFAQNAISSPLNQPLLSASINHNSGLSDQNAAILALANTTGSEREIYAEAGKIFIRNIHSALETEAPKGYVPEKIFACDNVTDGGDIATSTGQTYQVICATSGSPGAFLNSSSASGGSSTLYYQWQYSTDNYSWTNISGATSSTHTPSSISTLTYYRRLARRYECTTWVSSNTIFVAANMLPTVTLAKTDPSCGTSNGTITATGNAGFLGLRTITAQAWLNVSGTTVANLTSNANYPNSPSYTTTLTSLEVSADVADNFGARVIGYITPNTTGTYYFWIASDDNGELWLSSDESATNKTKIAYHTSYTGVREWNKFSTQKSAAINLVAGEIYYIEAIYKEGGGGDNLAVGWAKPGESTTSPSEVIPVDAIRPYTSSSLTTATYQYKLGSGSYQSSNVFTGLAAGTYTITIKDTYGCTSTSNVTLASSTPVVTADSNEPICAGQTLSLTGSATPTPTSYQWTGPASFSSSAQNPTRSSATAAMSGTYTLSATISGCGTYTATTSVTVSNVPGTPSATGATRCGTGTVTLTASGCSGTYKWYNVATGGTSLGTGSSFTTPSISSTTTYYVDCTVSVCTGSRASAVATINIANVSATGDTECAGSPIILGATGGTSYSWAGPNAFSSSSQNPIIPNGTAGMSGVYTVTITYAAGCTTTLTASVLVTDIPNAPTGSDVSRCGTGTVTLTATGCSGTYKWYTNNTTTANAASGASYTPSISATTTYYVSCTVNSCESTSRTPIQAIIASPPGAPNAVGGSNCGTGTVTLSASGCAGTYAWYTALTGGSSLGSGTTFTTPGISTTTDYYVECNVVCASTRTKVTATINANPSPSTVGDIECEGSTIEFQVTAGGATSYSWKGPNNFISSAQNPSIANSTVAMSGTYTVTVTNAAGCSATATAAVTVKPIPGAPSGNDVPRCGTGTVTLTATGCSGTYTWYAGVTGTSNLTTGASYTTPSISATTTYYVSCTVNGCESTSRTPIQAIVTSVPNAPSGVSGARCGPGTLTLSASGCAGTYTWYSAQTGGTNYGSGSSYTTPGLSATTDYYVECNYGCASPRTKVTAKVIPVPVATGDIECEGSTVNLSVTASDAASFSWVGPNFTSSAQNPGIPNSTPGMTGTYTVTVTTTAGCTMTATASVTVKANPAAPTGAGSRCGSGTVTLTGSGCSGGVYTWYANATTSTISGTGSTYTTSSLSSTTTYYVTCTLNGCVSQTRGTATATINPIPSAPTTTALSQCGTGPATLSATNCAGTVQWYGSATGGTFYGSGTFTTGNLAAPAAGSTSSNTYTYYASCTENGCTSTSRSALTVTVYAPPTASASNTGTHCMGTTFKLIGGGTNAESFSWSGPNGFSSSEQSPLVSSATSAMSGVYTLTVTAPNGCTATATTNMVINSSCASICTTPVAVTPTNPTTCAGTDGYIFVTEYSAGPYYESSMDGVTWYNSEKTYSGLGVGYYTIFIRDKTSKIVCRTISAVLISSTSSYFTGATTTSATSCSATDGKIVLQNVLGTDDVSWISSTSRSYVKVSSLSPASTISNLSQGTYYVLVSRGGNPLCYSERKITVGNSGAACPPGLCTTTKSSNLFPGGDFGSGSSQNGPSLAQGETQYSYAPITSDSPNDGNYAITNSTDYNGATAGGNIFTTWDILTQDHTTGDVNGYMMVVNASFNPDIVIERTVTNLCPNTRYEYSLWIYNICPAANTSGCTIKPNLTFLVDGVGKYTTGDITGTGWQKVGFTFTTGNATTSIFSIRNNATGGQGNDWVIDDIAITQCLPSIVQSADMTKCIGTTGQTVSATVTDGNTQYTYYKWQQSTDGGTTWTDLTSGTSTTFTSGAYTVSYALPTITAAMNGRKYKIVVGTSLNNLANSDCSYDGNETTLTVPIITVTPSANQNICTGNSATISASASGGSSPYTYSWSNSLGTGASKTVSPTTTTVYTVTVTDANGCTATTTTQVTVTSLPSAPTAVHGSNCGPGTVVLGTTGCSGTVTWYASSTATASLATGTNYTTPSINTTTSYFVTCTVNSCVSSSRTTVTATINTIPTASATGDVECAGNTINLSATGGGTYSWSGPAGFSSSAQNPTRASATISMAGIYTVTVTSTQGCSATATASVTVNPTPTPAISGNNTICVGQSTTLTASGGNIYVWSTGETTTSINVSPTTATTYTVTAYATNSSYTNLVKDQSIFNAANFTYINSSASYAGPQNLFDGVDNTVTDTFHATRITNGQDWGIGYTLGGDYLITSLSLDGRNDCCTERAKGGVMQIWKNGSMVYQSSIISGTGNGVISATPAPNVVGDEIRYIFLSGANTTSGETTLNFAEWIVGGSKVCSATTQVTVNVNTLPSPTAGSNSPVCSGKTLNLTASGGTSYQWAGPNGFSSNNQNPSITNVATPANAGIYTVTVTNANGCSSATTTSVTINATPSVTIGSNGPVCSGQTLTLTASGGTSYQWTGPNGFSSNSQNPNIANVNSIHSGTYSVTVTNASGCTATSTILITQPNVLTASISKVDVSCNGGNNGSATVTPSGGTSPYTYQWSPGGGTAATASNLIAGTYTVTVTDSKGCTATATVTITQPNFLTASISKVDVSCNGGNNGSATVTPSGGTSPYTYQWSPGGGTAATANNLSAGTYTVTVTDAKGCTATATVTITQPNVLTASISKVDVSCNGGNNGSATVTPSGGTSSYTYQWSPSGGTAATANNLSAGTYTVTVTDTKGCTATATITITQPNVLTTSISKVDVSCNGGNNGSATVTPSGGTSSYTYQWSPSGGTAATASNLSAGTYTVTVTDAKGCTATATVTITQPNVLTASISKVDVSCNGGNNGSATVTPAGGTSPYTYQWSPNGGTAATANNLIAGTYTVTVTDSKGCTATATVTITQPNVLTASISKVDVSCNGGNNGSATVTPSGGTSSYTYQWSSSGGTAATTSNRSAGTYTVTVTDSKGCTATATVTITQPNVLTASISKVDVSCNGGNNGSATVTPSGGTSSYTYQWSPGVGTAATASNLSAGTYTVTVTDSKGCTATATVTITQPNVLTASISKVDVSCNGGNNGSATVTPSGGTSPYTYQWSPGGGTAATTSNLIAGTYTVTVTDSKGCTATATVTITQPNVLTASISKVDVSCNGGNNGSATVTPTGGTSPYTYQWSPGVGTAATASNLSAGTYTVTVTDSKGCTATATVTITQPNVLTTSISKVDVSCNGGNNGSATVTLSGGTSSYTYQWSPSGGTAATASNLIAGTYTVTVKDSKGCTATATVTITQPNVLTASISKVDVSCNGGNNGSATVTPAGGTSPYTYQWSPSGGTAATANNLSAGTYTVTVTDSKGCTATATVTITQPNILTASITKVDVSCNGGNNGSATVTPSGGTSSYTYQWSPSGGTAATANNLSAGTYTVTVTDSKGCTATATITITQPNVLTASISKVDVSCNGGNNGSATVTPAGGTSSYTYQWSPGGGTAATASNLSAGTYTVTVTDSKGCTATATVTITQPNVLTANITKVDVSCNGGNNGSATVTPSGGTASYTYQWSPSGGTAATASNLIAGTYTVTVTDSKGCIATATVTIAQPVALTASAGSNSPVCAGQTLNLTASGSTNYSWSGPNLFTSNIQNPSIINVTSAANGIYTVTVTNALGCSATTTINVVIYDLPTPPTVIGASRCGEGSVTLTANGCVGGTIQWYDAQTGGNLVGTGITFATNTLTQSTFYFASCSTNNCSSASRTAGLARINSAPDAEVIPVNSTCISDNPQNNAKLLLNRYRNDDQYSYNIGTSYNSAIASAFVTIPSGGLVPASNLPNPTGSSQAYTVRIKNIDGCTIDRTVLLTKQCEGCPQNYCPPATVTKTK